MDVRIGNYKISQKVEGISISLDQLKIGIGLSIVSLVIVLFLLFTPYGMMFRNQGGVYWLIFFIFIFTFLMGVVAIFNKSEFIITRNEIRFKNNLRRKKGICSKKDIVKIRFEKRVILHHRRPPTVDYIISLINSRGEVFGDDFSAFLNEDQAIKFVQYLQSILNVNVERLETNKTPSLRVGK